MTQRMANALVRRVSVVTSASFDVRKGIMGKTVRRNVIATTTSHVTQKMGAATSDVPRAEWVTAVIKFVLVELLVLTVNRNVVVTIVSVAPRLGAVFVEQACGEDTVTSLVVMEHGELTACMNAPARKESAIGSQGSASVPMGGMGWNAKMLVLQIGMVSSVYCSVSVRTTPCVTPWMAPVSVRRASGAPSVTKCAPRGHMDQTVSTGVPVRMGQSVTTLQESVYVDRAGRV